MSIPKISATTDHTGECHTCGTISSFHVVVKSRRHNRATFYCGAHVPGAALDVWFKHLAKA